MTQCEKCNKEWEGNQVGGVCSCGHVLGTPPPATDRDHWKRQVMSEPDQCAGPPYKCAQCRATLGRAGQRCACGYRNVAPLGSLATVDARELAVLNEQNETLTEDNARLREELDKLSKELEVANVRYLKEALPSNSDAALTISKLRAFSEDQARQIQALEKAFAASRNAKVDMEADRDESDLKLGRLTRELERAKRGKP